MSAEIRAYARDDGKVVVEVWVGGTKRVSWEQSADDAESTGHGLIEKADAARRFVAGRTADGQEKP